MAVIGYPLDDMEYLAEDAATFHCTRSNGVYSSDEDYIVTAPGGMRVSVSEGIAWMRIARFGGGAFANREAETLAVETPDALLTRIDRVVIRYDIIQLASYRSSRSGPTCSCKRARRTLPHGSRT